MPERLGAMSSVDQALRRHLIDEMSSANTTKPRIAEQLEIVDRSNTTMLKHMLAACGWPRCVFRRSVTASFGIVTAEFGSVTDRFGDVTDGRLVVA